MTPAQLLIELETLRMCVREIQSENAATEAENEALRTQINEIEKARK